MKKILSCALAAVSALALAGCGGSGGSAASPFVITEDSGVVGYYTFDEGVEDNEVVDHSGLGANVYTGALDGSVTVEGVRGLALEFNGDDEYISLDSTMLEGAGATIAMWVKPAEWKDWARVFDIGDTKEDAWCGMDWETKMLRFDVIGGKGAVTIRSPLPQPGKWTHVAATFGAGSAALYINGKLSQKLPVGVTTEDVLMNVVGVYIGRSNWADPLFNGAMDEILVADREFSAAEIAKVYAGVVTPDVE
ncbi:MAG: LamG domain-containing protein [Treponema sp.]|nr:LamG domain-containing protein [Treponema sp.]